MEQNPFVFISMKRIIILLFFIHFNRADSLNICSLLIGDILFEGLSWSSQS